MLTQRIQSIVPSSTLRITAAAKRLQAQGKKVFILAAGEPDFDTPDPIKAAAIQAIQQGFTKYTPTTGIPELKEAIVTTLSRDKGLTYKPEHIAVTSGAKQALFNLLQVLVQPGDEVLIPSPYWVSYPEMVRLAGATPVEVKTDPKDSFRPDAGAIEKACTNRSRCLILNSPSNPTGIVLEPARLKKIGEVVKARDLWVISDEIYSRLIYGVEFQSIAALSNELYQKTVIVDGVSKAYSMTGWRIGYLAGPPDVVEATGRLQDHSTSNPSSISQKAALAALTGDQGCVKRMAEEFGKRRDFVIERLSRIPGVSFVKPDGAFYCFINVSAAGLSSTVFAERLLQEFQVALIPGAGFGCDTHVRISFATSLDVLKEGLDRIEQFMWSL